MICMVGFSESSAQSKSDAPTLQFELNNGMRLVIKYSQTSSHVTNVVNASSFNVVNTNGESLYTTNAFGQVCLSGILLKESSYTATGVIVDGNSEAIPIWTNRGSWGSLMAGLRTGFEFYSARNYRNSLLLCYKEKFDLYVETLLMQTNGIAVLSRFRQCLFTDSPAFAHSITNAVFIATSNQSLHLIGTGCLPIKALSWKEANGIWVRATADSNAWNDVISWRKSDNIYLWKGEKWVRQD